MAQTIQSGLLAQPGQAPLSQVGGLLGTPSTSQTKAVNTGKVTRAGRPLWQKDGELFSEKTITFRIGDKWLTFPSIGKNGEQIPQRQIEAWVVENGPVDPITGEIFPVHKTLEEAETYAKKRSRNLIKDEG